MAGMYRYKVGAQAGLAGVSDAHRRISYSVSFLGQSSVKSMITQSGGRLGIFDARKMRLTGKPPVWFQV